jgi:small-conductance mechanosensitive channel
VTVWTLLQLALSVAVVVYLSGVIQRWVFAGLLSRTALGSGERQAIATVSRYVLVVIGFVIVLQTTGIDMTALNVVAATVGIGIGFGLQNVADNFISGLIVLIERPVKIGDRIEVGGVSGDVVNIGARSTTVVTNDNISIIIPNSKFITENVINWSHTDPRIRFRIPVLVSYGADIRLVERLLVQAASGNKDVLLDPPPSVRLVEFADNGVSLELLAWTSSLLQRRGFLVSRVNFAIWDLFREHNIEFPFPQRDIHIRSGSIEMPRDNS